MHDNKTAEGLSHAEDRLFVHNNLGEARATPKSGECRLPHCPQHVLFRLTHASGSPLTEAVVRHLANGVLVAHLPVAGSPTLK